MVVGKNVNKALTRANPAPKLPALPKLTLRSPGSAKQPPCVGAMISVLSCWASHGTSAKACVALEGALRDCVDTPRPAVKSSRKINSQLNEHYHKMRGPMKKKK